MSFVLKNKNKEFRAAHLSGFSLAEAMVMLVIVAVLMAVSAPLITRRAAADAKRLILQGVDGGMDVVVALGDRQSFGVGTSNPQNPNQGGNVKFHVMGNSLLNGDLTITGNNNTTRSIFINGRQLTTDNNGNLNITALGSSPANIPPTAEQDGYLVASISSDNKVIVNDVQYAPTITCSAGESCSVTYEHMPVVIPVAKGSTMSCTGANCTFVPFVMNIPAKEANNDSASQESN